ncbi:hypothetical protein LIER_18036 [Lithospermum erythrorhizon]|uniref:Integrase catalytic domain-containing protein n=1 Tax=Lithospermum erythrorhizon TaxID=34254 RepID=A0AAV3QI21_LITER
MLRTTYGDVIHANARQHTSPASERNGSGASVPVPKGDLHITRFRIPQLLVTDNGTQFTAGKIENLCMQLGIDHRMIGRRQCNIHKQMIIWVIFKCIKKWLQQEGSSWDQELPTVPWSFRMTPKPITGETPFSLVYGSEALISVEIQLDTDLKDKIVSYYNKKVWSRQFLVGDLVLRARQASSHGKPRKLEFPWEGSYIFRRIMGPITYELETLEGRQVTKSWNACHLTKYYV